jgi:type IV pilus assembly protein PilQ
VTSDFAEPRGNWEHTAYQTDTRFIMEVKQQIEDPNRLVKPGFVDERWRTAERS